ncbi:MAG TPA: DUF1815 family protein [Coleofasciculaceae cyanobacterium]
MFLRLAEQHRQFVRDLVMSLQALAIVLERRGYLASCYTCGDRMNSASFMVSLGDNHLIRFLVSDYGITWTEMRDDRELMKIEGAEAIGQLQELAKLLKVTEPPQSDRAVVTPQVVSSPSTQMLVG